ncbi:dTMP kinase [Streptomyces cellostaticus]|uniref:dTMP kinase n=1 Tax=Streptomyces cellostaticus TaxID=67285 RepID=UPI0020274AF4|nr:dTMP kinase [Streptomyces cellostaticus]
MESERWKVPPQGALIALCGLDGSGKTTQAQLLEKRLMERRTVYRTRPVTAQFRDDPTLKAFLNQELSDADMKDVVPELVLFSAMDRLRHMRTEMLPRMRDGAVVVSDRYVYSSYAWMVPRGIPDLDWVMQLNRYLPEPQLTVYLDIPAEVAVDRIRSRGDKPRWEELDHDRMSQVRNIFLGREWGKDENYHVLDGQQPVHVLEEHIGRLAEAALQKRDAELATVQKEEALKETPTIPCAKVVGHG